MRVPFTEASITDHKRIVRREHYVLARTILRERDHAHHRAWKVLTLAGGAPHGEVETLRTVMPRCAIVAVDRDPACVDAARDAGVDAAVCCDVGAAHPTVESHAPFDVVSLDFCAGATVETRTTIARCQHLVATRGVMIVTFAYGRDVVEHFDYLMRKALMSNAQRFRRFTDADVPRELLGRILAVVNADGCDRMRSVMTYRGPVMPMCSLVMTKNFGRDPLAYRALRREENAPCQ